MAQLKFAVLGIDHRHIYGMTSGMIDAGSELAGVWNNGHPDILAGFNKRFPDAPMIADRQEILNDPAIELVLIAARPSERAALANQAMQHGKDVMVDKPGCITLRELADLRETVKETGRIWSVNFSERFEVRAATVASQLVNEGQIGEVVQTLGLGPHRLNAHSRPDWFFDRSAYGGILTDIASHQIDQFLHYANVSDAQITHAAVGNFANPGRARFEDFGEISLCSGSKQAYIRVDWYTPDALPSWGDGRLFITGTEGTIETRKYVDVAGRPGTDHLFLVNGTRCEHIDCSTAPLPYFERLVADIADRTETACGQSHTFKVAELSLTAQQQAHQRGYLITSKGGDDATS